MIGKEWHGAWQPACNQMIYTFDICVCGNSCWISISFFLLLLSLCLLLLELNFLAFKSLTNKIPPRSGVVWFTLWNLQMFNVCLQKGKHQKYPFQFNKILFALTFSTRFNQSLEVFKGTYMVGCEIILTNILLF